jgi:hypothetical protein
LRRREFQKEFARQYSGPEYSTTVTTKIATTASMKIVENNGQYKITLPKDLVLDKGWKAGDEIRFVEDTEGRIFLKVLPSQK